MSSLKTNLKNQHGFTILELLIATIVLSILLVLCATAIVTVGRIFHKGNTENKVQQTARDIVDDISQSVQFGVLSDSDPEQGSRDGVNWVCVGKTRYTYSPNKSKSDTNKYVLWKDNPESCGYLDISGPDVPSVGGRELLGNGMRAPNIGVTRNGSLFNLSVTVAYGDDDLFATKYTDCVPKDRGGQFCATTTINTNVLKRL